MELAKVIPLIRDVVPSLIAEELVDVQPMSSDVGSIFDPELRKYAVRCVHRFGEIWHHFAYGYMIWTGKDWMYIPEFVEKYPDINYEEMCNMAGWPYRPLSWYC